MVAAAAGLRSAMARLLASLEVAPVAVRMGRAMRASLERREMIVDNAARSLDLVGPEAVLRRGYSMTMSANGRVVRSVADVVAGETVQTRLADGSFGSVVQGGQGRHGPVRATSRLRPRVRRGDTKVGARDQLDLFRAEAGGAVDPDSAA